MVSNKTLVKVAVYGAFGCISAAMYMRYKIQQRISNSEYFRAAFKVLRSHKGAISVLGEPIKQLNFDLTDAEKNFCDGKTAKFEVNVKGPKDYGKIFFYAERLNDKWNINSLELEVNKHPDKRLVVKKLEDIQQYVTVK